eukprot:Hpha_TRINITY_DN15313_c1_g1::TRINITY_DN15313_c1_g1_i1::g.90127::m.90127
MSTLSGPWLKRRIEKQNAEIYLDEKKVKKAIKSALGDKKEKKDKKAGKKKSKKKKKKKDDSSEDLESSGSDMYNPTIGGFWSALGVNRYEPFHSSSEDEGVGPSVAQRLAAAKGSQRWVADYKSYRTGLGPQTSAELMRLDYIEKVLPEDKVSSAARAAATLAAMKRSQEELAGISASPAAKRRRPPEATEEAEC